MDYEQIRYEVADGVLTITLNRPDRLNAFTPAMLAELLDPLDHADADDDVRAVIFTGEGRAFCAGAALQAGGSTVPYRQRRLGEGGTRRGGGRVQLALIAS